MQTIEQIQMNQGISPISQIQGPLSYGVSIPQQPQMLGQTLSAQRVIDIPMKQGEVVSQYLIRKQVYKNAFQELNDHDKAYCYANIYSNIKFLQAEYPISLTEKVMRYAPSI